MDIKFQCINGFKLVELTDREYFVNDLNSHRENGIEYIDVYNVFLVCKPGNQMLYYTISNILKNVAHQNYGEDFVNITGPRKIGCTYAKIC